MKLFSVCQGKNLFFPPSIDKESLWLQPGGVLDLEDPFVAECVRGQEYKLEPVTGKAQPTPVSHARFQQMRETFFSAGEQKKAAEIKADERVLDSIPRPDVRPRKGEEKKNAQVPGPVSQINPR
jgi:hypothetical protein